MTALSVHDVRVWRGHQTLIEDVSFQLPSGSVLKLTGPNGAGKTTLLKCLSGVYAGWSGRVAWGDEETRFLPGMARTVVIGHQNALKSVWTPRQNLRHWAPHLDFAAHDAALQAFGVRRLADIPVRHLSAGQARRACLARLILTSADVWLLDEPGVSLDVEGRQMLADHIETFRQQGGVVIAATHGDVSLPHALELRFSAQSMAATGG